MIILDTPVLSELMRLSPEPAVMEWLNRQPNISMWTSAITVLEVRFGIARLPSGRRRLTLEQAFDRVLAERLGGRVVPFEGDAALATATLMAARRERGRPGDLRDSMIAGIAVARRATLATRNTRHFDDLPVPVLDPWGGVRAPSAPPPAAGPPPCGHR